MPSDEQAMMVVRRQGGGGYIAVPVPDAPLATQQQVQIDGLVTTARSLPVTFAQAEAVHATLQHAIDVVAAQVAALANRPPPAPTHVDTVDLGPLQEAVAALQAAEAAELPPADVAPVTARVAAVEAELARLAKLVAALPPGLTKKP